MNPKEFWIALRKPFIVLAVIWVGMGLLAYWAEYQRLQTHQSLELAEQAVQQAKQAQVKMQDRLHWLSLYQPAYEQTVSAGFVGDEQRLAWIGNLQAVQQKYQLPEVQYALGEQVEYQPTFVALGRYKMHQSMMRLDMHASHEGQMNLLLTRMQDENLSMMVRDCLFKHTTPNQPTDRVESSCQVDWLTIQAP